MSEDQKDPSQKTEEPTSRKLEKAREEGDVVTSRETITFLLFTFFTISLYFGMPLIMKSATKMLAPYTYSIHDMHIDAFSIKNLYTRSIIIFAVIGAIPILSVITAIILGYWIQRGGFIFSTKALKFDLNRISPLTGFGKLFSMRSIVELIKNILKISLVGFAIFIVIIPEIQSLTELYFHSWSGILKLLSNIILKMFITVSIIMALLALFDYLYQRHTYMQKMRMTKQEVKDEMKQSEGDQEIKAKMKSIRIQRMKRRMLAAVPKATVVITNPTHYAVALFYLPESMKAPQVVAKGQDHLALKIREVAKENSVPIVENKALARTLFESVELDDIIPYEHYKAVADVIAYIMKMRPTLYRH